MRHNRLAVADATLKAAADRLLVAHVADNSRGFATRRALRGGCDGVARSQVTGVSARLPARLGMVLGFEVAITDPSDQRLHCDS